jgi:hypothetical protein
MSDATSPAKRGVTLDRAADLLLDRGGETIYGDERERFELYEATVLANGIQWHTALWTLTAISLATGGALDAVLLIVFAAVLLPVIAVPAVQCVRQRIRLRLPGADEHKVGLGLRLAIHLAPLVAFLGVVVVHLADGDHALLAVVLVSVSAAVGLVECAVRATWRARRASSSESP